MSEPGRDEGARPTMERAEEVVDRLGQRAGQMGSEVGQRPPREATGAGGRLGALEPGEHPGRCLRLEDHLVASVDHFVLSEGNTLVVTLVRNWLDKYFPVPAGSR